MTYPQPPYPPYDPRQEQLRRAMQHSKWQWKKPRFNKWFFVMIIAFGAYLFIVYVIKPGLIHIGG